MTDKKIVSIFLNAALLVWFSLDMIGVYFNNSYLVTRSWSDDGFFWIIYTVFFVAFLTKEKAGKPLLVVWLSVWLVIQLISHELCFLTEKTESMIEYFKGSLKWIDSEQVYIPDVYHTLLHILIILALISTIKYRIKSNDK